MLTIQLGVQYVYEAQVVLVGVWCICDVLCTLCLRFYEVVLMLVACLVLLSGICLFLIFGKLYDWYSREYVEDGYEYWECPSCGCVVEAITIEGIVEGMRIHDKAVVCEKEEE